MLTNILTELDRIFLTEVKDRIANITGQNQLARMYRLILFYSLHTKDLIDYFRLFIVATGCPSERRPQKTVSCYGG